MTTKQNAHQNGDAAASARPALSDEDRELVQMIGQQLRQIIQGTFSEPRHVDRLDELGILANLVNRVARELHLSRQRDQRQRREIERQLAELSQAHEVQQRLVDTIREISTPVLTVHPGVLLLPIVGALDPARAEQLLETLLARAAAAQARVVILDITGAHTIDTHVANALLSAARAVGLVGARVILCGITPEIAQVVVSLGIDLSAVTTCADLQAALALALRLTGRRPAG